MKVDIKANGEIHIIAETVIEAGAINWANWMGPPDYECRHCGHVRETNIVFDCSVLGMPEAPFPRISGTGEVKE